MNHFKLLLKENYDSAIMKQLDFDLINEIKNLRGTQTILTDLSPARYTPPHHGGRV